MIWNKSRSISIENLMDTQKTKLQQARINRGISLRDLEEMTGISRATLSRIETGKQVPCREHARLLFDFYHGEILLSEIYDPKYYMEMWVR